MIVNFKTTNIKKSFINIEITNIKKDISLDDDDVFYSSDNTEEDFNDSNNHKENYQSKSNDIITLQDMLVDSLNYLSEQRLFVSTLPNEINIQFTNTSFIDKFKSLFSKNELAEVSFNSNTIYISTDLLNKSPKDQFLQEFSHKFQDQQSLVDAFFYHEFSHIIFKNTFNNVFNTYSQLNNFYPKIKNKNFNNVPLYQVLRNLEENFSDSFSAFIHKNKHNLIDLYSYFAARNATTKNNSLGYDLNINSLGIFFKEVNNIELNNFNQNFSIDNICQQLYQISIKSTLDIIKQTIDKNPQFEVKLIENLTQLNSFNKNYKDSLNNLLNIQNSYIILPQKNPSEIKNRMFSMRDSLTTNNNSNQHRL